MKKVHRDKIAARLERVRRMFPNPVVTERFMARVRVDGHQLAKGDLKVAVESLHRLLEQDVPDLLAAIVELKQQNVVTKRDLTRHDDVGMLSPES